MLLKAVSEKFTRKLVLEQEILSNISDCIIQVYVAESVVLRLKKMEAMKGEEYTKPYRDMADIFVYDAAARINKFACDTTYSFAFGEVRDLLEKGIRKRMEEIYLVPMISSKVELVKAELDNAGLFGAAALCISQMD